MVNQQPTEMWSQDPQQLRGGEAGDWFHLGPCVKLRNLLLGPFTLLIAPKIEPGVCPDHGCQSAHQMCTEDRWTSAAYVQCWAQGLNHPQVKENQCAQHARPQDALGGSESIRPEWIPCKAVKSAPRWPISAGPLISDKKGSGKWLCKSVSTDIEFLRKHTDFQLEENYISDTTFGINSPCPSLDQNPLDIKSLIRDKHGGRLGESTWQKPLGTKDEECFL